MASSANSDTELLTEHFGYPPVSLLDDIINSVNILAERALNSVEQALLRQPPASLGFKPPKKPGSGKRQEDDPDALQAAADAHRHEVENGTHQLETLLCASIDRNFDKFELYVMRNILCVRPEDRDWIRLAHYEGLDFGPHQGQGEGGDAADGDDDDDDDATVAHLHRRLQASLRLGHLLDVETARNDAMLQELRAAAGPLGGGVKTEQPKALLGDEDDSDAAAAAQPSLAFLLDRGTLTESDAHAPLTTTTAFALSQLPALRQLSGELRRMAPSLAESAAAAAAVPEQAGPGREGDKSWRRERLEYIEGSTRRHLERVRGLDLGRNGEVRGGESSNGGGSGNGNSNNPAVEPEALTNILNILRENHGASSTAKAPPHDPPGDGDEEAMDES